MAKDGFARPFLFPTGGAPFRAAFVIRRVIPYTEFAIDFRIANTTNG